MCFSVLQHFLAKQGLSFKRAETLLADVVKNTDSVTYDAGMVKSVIEQQVGDAAAAGGGGGVCYTSVASENVFY